ncbi:MAG: hypothetical protein FJ276_30775, partial [Planctomycetes bacterium]|nr:hypothetical protein [Planctomycetota bacterium]
MPVDVTPIADRVFAAVTGCFARERLLAAVLEETCTVLSAGFAAVASIDGGVWHPVARSGEGAFPYDLMAEALDHERLVVQGPWVAAPLPCLPGPREVLVVRGASSVGGLVERTVAQLASWLAAALTAVAIQSSQRRRVERLEAILEISAQWRQTLEMDRLLEQMAEAAVRLLAAERASIFLWDRGTKTLVGRPALGVEGGELRIPDNTGVVGQVVHSGEPRRVDL